MSVGDVQLAYELTQLTSGDGVAPTSSSRWAAYACGVKQMTTHLHVCPNDLLAFCALTLLLPACRQSHRAIFIMGKCPHGPEPRTCDKQRLQT
mgnify:CR=1 FL=1